MRISDMSIPKWMVIPIQILFFFLFIFPGLNEFNELYLQIPLIILEIMIIIPFLFKLQKKWFYYFWVTQVYLFILFKIQFYFEETFFFQNPEPTAVWTMTGIFSFVFLLISAGFIFGEKAVKPILVTLSSTTTLAVLLIVVFITKEGYLAFIENDPIEFLTGDEWEGNYLQETQEHKTITIYVEDYDFTIEPVDDHLFISPGINATMHCNLTNIGSYPDSYMIFTNNLGSTQINLSRSNISLEPGEFKIFSFNVTPSQKGSFPLVLTVRSISSEIEKDADINLIVGDRGIDLTPDNFFLDLEGYTVGKVVNLEVINLGLYDEELMAEIEYPSFFRPSISGEGFDWDYSRDHVNFTLEKGKTKEISLNPRMIELNRATHNINLTVRSLNDPEIYDKATLTIEYSTTDYLNIEEKRKTIAPGMSGIFNLSVNVDTPNEDVDLIIEDHDIEELEFSIFCNGVSIPIIEGIAKVKVNSTRNTTVDLMVKVKENTQQGQQKDIRLTIKDEGEKPTYSIGPFIVGTFLTTIIALIIAIPLGVGSAIFLAEYCPSKIRRVLRPLYELLAGIPSVIYGLWGFLAFGPFLMDHFFPILDGTLGSFLPFFRITAETPPLGGVILTAGLILAIMILPYIITLSEDAIRAVPRGLLEGSIALGTTKWQTIRGVVLKKAKSGIIASIILAMGRAIGETMAVVMVLGFVLGYPDSILEPSSTMTGVIAGTFGWAFDQDYTRHAIFGIAIVLFVLVFILNIIVYRIHTKASSSDGLYNRISKWLREKVGGKSIEIKTMGMISINQLKKKFTPAKRIHAYEYIMRSLFILSAVIVVLSLVMVLADVLMNGGTSLKLDYLIHKEVAGGIGEKGNEGGFANAIVGSIILTAFALAVAAPLSIGAAIYVTQYTKKRNIFTRMILFTSDTLASTPSIVFGAFGFVFFVMELKFSVSMLAGGLTLGMMVIPLLLRSSIEALNSIPTGFRDASLALGASKWQTVWKVILPPAMGGITSGVILSIGRAIGETAAIIFTAGYAFGYTESLMQPVATMPSMIYGYYELSGTDPILESKVYSAAFVLILLVLVLNSIARIFQWRSSKMMKGR